MRLALACGAALVGAAAELARPWPIKSIVDYALGDRPLPPWLADLPLVHWFAGTLASPVEIVVGSVLVGALVILLSAAASLLTQILVFNVGQDMVFDLSTEVFSKLQRLSLSFHNRNAVGDLSQRIGSDAFVVQAAVCSVAIPGLASVVLLVGMFVLMLRLDATMTVITASLIPLVLICFVAFRKSLDHASRHQWARQGELMAFLQESLSGIKAIQGYAREPQTQRILETRGRALGGAYRHSLAVGASYNQTTVVLTGMVGMLLIGVGATRVLANMLSLGDLFVFLGYLTMVIGPITGIASAVGTAVSVGGRGRRVLEILDSTDEVPESDTPLPIDDVLGEIEFEDVTFGYHAADGDSPASTVFQEISFKVHPGQIVAIIGVTGAGKSSLVGLLSRLYDPSSGRIRLDGKDMRDLSLRSLRESVAVVLQDPILFSVSVADNIAFGRPGASRDEIMAAARIARADEFIQRLPLGYDTEITERGTNLSGGERQRIALARALVKDAPILILDEPTSSLDAHTEAEIFEGLSEYLKGRTAFIISHRLTTIRRADLILSLENGSIVERGTHEVLVDGRGVYARLYRSQNIAAN